MASVIVTDEIEKYIMDNFPAKTMVEIAKDLGIHHSLVVRTAKRLNIKTPMRQKVEKQYSFKRHPAKYDNKSREYYVDYWLNYELKSN